MLPPVSQSPTDNLTTTAQDVVDDQNQTDEPSPAEDPKAKKRNEEFRQRIDQCKSHRRKLIANWTISIDYRRGKVFASQSDEDTVAVNLDWSLTKAKQAQLFSQIPKARINHGEDLLLGQTPWVFPFQKKLNDTLVLAGIESAMDECLPDCINASGFGAVLVSYEAITQDVQIPKDPTNPDAGMVTIPKVVDRRYLTSRISPSDLLWPINYPNSNFDGSSWIGRSGRITWAAAVQQYKLKEDDKAAILGEDRPSTDKLTHDVDRDKLAADDMVGFDEIFYREYDYIDGTQAFSRIHRLVFLNGKDKPVVDEPWNGQKIAEDGTVLGAQRYPIRVLKLAYITDETIPPSDSAIGRPQVNEINKGRTQMIRQRERSLPIRAFDVNRLDPAVAQNIMHGTWQTWIPVQGDATKVVSEIARANMPPENFKFDEIAKKDLFQSWIDPYGAGKVEDGEGSQDDVTKGIGTRLTRERAIVASFFVSIAEVMGGLLCLYEDPVQFGQGFDPKVSTLLKCSVLSDSTIVLDSNQKLSRLNQFMNTYAKSGWVNLEPVLQEIAQLAGLDPAIVLSPPKPKPPVEPNISLRLTGVEDLLNPLALAMLIKSGQAPPPELIDQAKLLIEKSVVPSQPSLPGVPGQPPGAPPTGIPGPLPSPPPPGVGQANPQMTALDKITERTQTGGTQ